MIKLNKYFITFPSWSPGSEKYCEIHAPSKQVARILAMEFYRNHWVTVYTKEEFDGQVEDYDLKPTVNSPVTSEPSSEYYENNKEDLLKKLTDRYL